MTGRRAPRIRIMPLVALLALLVITGCSLGDVEERTSRTTTEDDAASTTSAASAVSASVVAEDGDGSESETSESSTDQPATTEATQAESTTTTEADTTTTDAAAAETTSTTETPVVVVPGDSGSFTSPSGNIACNMSTDLGASCWISEKEWTIAASTDPDCDLDFGNAVDVSAGGVTYPCYSDFSWNPNADALAYGNAMEVGDFRCTSARDGVSCLNGDGRGFKVSRAAVVQF